MSPADASPDTAEPRATKGLACCGLGVVVHERACADFSHILPAEVTSQILWSPGPPRGHALLACCGLGWSCRKWLGALFSHILLADVTSHGGIRCCGAQGYRRRCGARVALRSKSWAASSWTRQQRTWKSCPHSLRSRCAAAPDQSCQREH